MRCARADANPYGEWYVSVAYFTSAGSWIRASTVRRLRRDDSGARRSIGVAFFVQSMTALRLLAPVLRLV
jgi:hypothetical protein